MPGLPDLSLASAPYELGDEGADAILAAEPYTGLRFHFGMLLGVQDFDTLAAQPRAKLRLHNAWLHGPGVVWGLGVDEDIEHGELRVAPGLALDGCGRELHLDAAACVAVGAWFERHKDELTITEDGARRRFSAHVVARFRSCLTRQVPALAEPCDGGGAERAYSRIVDTVELLLMPGTAPPAKAPYHRLRVLFGLEPPAPGPDDDAVIAALRDVLARPAAERPAALLAAFREFAALDTAALGPPAVPEGEQASIVPALPDDVVVLADVDIVVEPNGTGGWSLVSADPDISVRPSHVATSTIQELLCGMTGVAGHAARTAIAKVARADNVLTLTPDGPLAAASVTDAAIAVSTFDEATGWKDAVVDKVAYDPAAAADPADPASPTGPSMTIELHDKPAGLLRLVVRGTGPAPVLDATLQPLAGASGDPPPAPGDGRDFVHMEGIAP